MPKIKINQFGTLIPRSTSRDLPPGAAQVNNNLLASSSDFRPVQADLSVAAATTNAQTLYRTNRNSAGVFRTSDADGWITQSAYMNYVRGAVADDAMERTYFSMNDGTDYPKATDITGAIRRLGVPAPTAPAVTLNTVTAFTLADANNWVVSTLAPALVAAIKANLVESRFSGSGTSGSSTAGVYTLHGGTLPTDPSQRSRSELGNLMFSISSSSATAAGLTNAQLDPVTVGGSVWFGVAGLPLWGYITNQTALANSLRTILNPKTGAQLWSDARLPTIAASLAAMFDPALVPKTKRDNVDAAVSQFYTAFGNLTSPPTAPTIPSKPTVAEYDSNGNKSPVWQTYDAQMVAYQTAFNTYTSDLQKYQSNVSAQVSQMVSSQITALSNVQAIESLYASLKGNLLANVNSWIGDQGLVQSASSSTGIVAVDGDRIVESRFYVATFVTDWAEESAPSAVSSLIELSQYDHTTVARPSVPSGRNITKWRLYRTNTGASGSAAFQYVDEMLIATTSYVDNLKAAQLGEVCPSTAWAEPPTRTDPSTGNLRGANPYLRQITSMANGVMTGFIDNYVAFCEPYKPYAWPAEYQIPLKLEIVGIDAFQTTVFVGTNGSPSLIVGSDSSTMSEIQLDGPQCSSARSIVAFQGGAFYASPDGYCLATPAGVKVITSAYFSREDWLAMDPTTILAFSHDNILYWSYTGNGGGCYAWNSDTNKLTTCDLRFTAVFNDMVSDAVFCVTGSNVYKVFSTGRRTGNFKSAKIRMEHSSPLAVGRIMGLQNGSQVATLKWYGDGVLRHTATVTDTNPFRIPPGRYLEHEVELTSTARINSIELAGNVNELKGEEA